MYTTFVGKLLACTKFSDVLDGVVCWSIIEVRIVTKFVANHYSILKHLNVFVFVYFMNFMYAEMHTERSVTNSRF